MNPRRIQLSRKRGWKKPEGAVVCSRPGRWGNPHTLSAERGRPECAHFSDAVLARIAVNRFAADIRTGRSALTSEDVRRELRGKDLCCWCRLCPAHKDGRPWDVECADCAPCHVDALLAIAQGGPGAI